MAVAGAHGMSGGGDTVAEGLRALHALGPVGRAAKSGESGGEAAPHPDLHGYVGEDMPPDGRGKCPKGSSSGVPPLWPGLAGPVMFDVHHPHPPPATSVVGPGA